MTFLKKMFIAISAFLCLLALMEMSYHEKMTQKKNTDFPPITTRYPSSVNEIWARVAVNSHTRRVAFFDSRNYTWGGPVLLTLTSYDPRQDKRKHEFYAKVVYSNRTEICLPSPGNWSKLRTVVRPLTEHVVSWFVIFKLPSHDVPNTMFMSEHKDCSSPSAYITVFYEGNNPPLPTMEFALCLYQPMFRIRDHEMVAAWFEMNRELGAEKIYLYYQDKPDNVIRMVQKYVDDGFVEAFGWHNNFTVEADNNFLQQMSITDCVYRNMFRTKYLVLHDVDELIMPMQTSTWHELMKQIDTDPKISQFRFCYSYMHDAGRVLPGIDNIDMKDIGCNNTDHNLMSDIPVFFKRTQRTADFTQTCVNNLPKRSKNIIKPIGINYATVHSAVPANGYKMQLVDIGKGLMYHFRHKDYTKKEEKVDDFIMLKYMNNVLTNVARKLCGI